MDINVSSETKQGVAGVAIGELASRGNIVRY